MRTAILSRCRFGIALGAGLCAAGPALAMDPNCAAAMSAMSALKAKPFHIYMTTDEKFSSARMSSAAASIGMGGTKTAEEIWTGKDVYVRSRGKWIDMQTNFAEMSKDSGPDSDESRKKAQCQVLPDEAAFGQPSYVYRIHNPESGIDTKVWVSKAAHLPVKSEMTQNAAPMTRFTSSRYDYANVRAPANAISMQDMVKRR